MRYQVPSRRGFVVVVCVFMGCGASEPESGFRSAILITVPDAVVESGQIDGALVWIQRTSVTPGRGLFVTGSGETETTYALMYDCALEDMGYAPGEYGITVRVGSKDGYVPPGPSRLLMNDGITGWSEMSSVPSFLRQVRVPYPAEPCASFRVTTGTISADRGGIGFGVALDDSRALFAPVFSSSEVIALWLVEDGSVELLSRVTRLPNGGAFLDPIGELWLVGALGRTAVGNVDDGLVVQDEQASRGEQHVWLDGRESVDEAFELFAVSDQASFDRFDGKEWEPLASGDVDPRLTIKGDVVRVGPGEAVAVGIISEGILRHRRLPDGTGATSFESLRELGMLEIPTAVAQVDGLGTVVGDQFGRFYVSPGSDPEGWKLLAETADRTQIQTMVPFRGGFLFVQRTRRRIVERTLRQYHPEAGFCPPIDELLPDESIFELAPFANGVLLSGVEQVGLARSTLGASSCADGPDMTTWEPPTPE